MSSCPMSVADGRSPSVCPCGSQHPGARHRRGRWHDPPGLHPRLAQIPLRTTCGRAQRGPCLHQNPYLRVWQCRVGKILHFLILCSQSCRMVCRCGGGSCRELDWSTEGFLHVAWGVARRIKRGMPTRQRDTCTHRQSVHVGTVPGTRSAWSSCADSAPHTCPLCIGTPEAVEGQRQDRGLLACRQQKPAVGGGHCPWNNLHCSN